MNIKWKISLHQGGKDIHLTRNSYNYFHIAEIIQKINLLVAGEEIEPSKVEPGGFTVPFPHALDLDLEFWKTRTIPYANRTTGIQKGEQET